MIGENVTEENHLNPMNRNNMMMLKSKKSSLNIPGDSDVEATIRSRISSIDDKECCSRSIEGRFKECGECLLLPQANIEEQITENARTSLERKWNAKAGSRNVDIERKQFETKRGQVGHLYREAVCEHFGYFTSGVVNRQPPKDPGWLGGSALLGTILWEDLQQGTMAM